MSPLGARLVALGAVHCPRGEAGPPGAPPLPRGLRARRLQSRRSHCLWTIQAWQTHVEERIARGLPEGTPGALRATKKAAAKKAGGAASPRAAAAGLGTSSPAKAQARPQSARPASTAPLSQAVSATAAARPATAAARPATARPASAAGAGAARAGAARRGGLPATAGRVLCSGELRGSGLCVQEFELGPDELPPVRLWVEIDEAAGRLRGQQAPTLRL